jgi:tetratricopeptide (TPR) repeat protein
MRELSDEVGRPVGAHIGLAAGQVVASQTGSGTHREYTVTGDSVNLASRLTDAAATGAILISDLVRPMLPPHFACREAGKLTVKGLSEPVQAWRLIGVDDAAAERPPFVGRQAELAQFKAVLAACRGTGTGQAAVVRGEAGIGKTRVVEEFQTLAEGAGFACHAALVLDFGAGVGQDATRTLVRSLLGLTASSDSATAQAAAGRAVSDRLVANEQRVYLNDLLDLPQPTALRALFDAMDNVTRNRGKQATVVGLVQALSKRQPLLLVVEDVHWADRPTLEHLATLAETVAGCPALLVMTTRIEGDPLDPAWRSSVVASPLVTIDLGPLRPQEAIALASAYLDANADFAKRCLERAAGNPLFLEQLLHHAEQSSAAGVPGSVQSLVQARMDQLDPHDKQALQAASVFGQRFALEPLRHLIDDPDYDSTPLVRRFLIRPIGDDFLFAHALIRDAVYDSLLRTRRRGLHQRAAAWFADRDLALHAEHLDRAEDPGAPQAYLRAARVQATDYRYERARALTERGLTLAADPAARFALTSVHGEILHDLGSMAESRAAYERALEAATDDRDRAAAWLGLAAVKRVTDDLDGAFADLARAQPAAEAHGLTEQLARIHFLRGNLHFPRGDIEGCLAEHHLSLELARATGSPESEAQALGGIGDAEYMRGRLISAYRHFQACVDLASCHGLGRIEVANRPMAAITRWYAQGSNEALEDALAAVAAAVRVGHRRAEMIAHHAAYFCRHALADAAGAWSHVEQALILSRQLGARRFEAEALAFRAELHRVAGRQREALAAVSEALSISRQTGIAFIGPTILAILALATLDERVRVEALAEGEALLAAGSACHNHLQFRRDAIEACLRVGAWDEAMRHANALEDYTRPEPLPWSGFFVARARALTAVGQGRADEATRQELKHLAAEAGRLGYRIALPPIEEALARL